MKSYDKFKIYQNQAHDNYVHNPVHGETNKLLDRETKAITWLLETGKSSSHL